MTRKRKKRKKPITKPQFNPPNIVILGLALIIGFALFSAVDNFFYSDDKVKFEEKIDLATLLTVSKYQNKYGEKISIQILNGCGKVGLAENYSEFLIKEVLTIKTNMSKKIANFFIILSLDFQSQLNDKNYLRHHY